MDRIERRGRKLLRRYATLATLSLMSLVTNSVAVPPSHAGSPASTVEAPTTPAELTPSPAETHPAPVPPPTTPIETGPLTWAEAVNQTRLTGVPTLLIVTSKTVPTSTETAQAVLASPAVARLRDQVIVSEISAQDEPEQIKRMVVTQFPTFALFRRAANGQIEAAASRRGVMSAEALTGWLIGVGLTDATAQAGASPNDPDVRRTNGLWPRHQGPTASPQYPAPPPIRTAPPVPPPAPPQTVEREVVVEEQPAEREVIVEQQPAEREVIIEREVVREAAPREVIVERAPAPERVREVYVQRVPAAPRNVLTRSVTVERSAPPAERVREVIVRAAPRQRVVERAPERVREVVVERVAAPAPERVREVVVEREAPRATRVRAVAEEQPAVRMIRPGLFGRALGGAGDRLRLWGLPRVDVAVETERTYRFAQPTERDVYEAAPRAAQHRGLCARPTAQPEPAGYAPSPPAYAPAPQYLPPLQPYAPSPQSN